MARRAQRERQIRREVSRKMCVLCGKRPRWHDKNNPGDRYCKRCYHRKWKENNRHPPSE